jgi:general secretion pathway protein D
VRVVADTENNNLLILGDAPAYRMIVDALRRLDIEPLQVLIEAQIVEVGLNDQLEYGLEWFFDNRVNGNTFTIQSQNDASASLNAQVPGFSWTIADSSDVIRAVFNALAQESLLRVISSPSLLVLDNRTASIQVGDQQPVSVGQATNTSGGGVILESIEFRDTGVSLGVTPRVNASGLVLMEVSQEVTDVGEVDAATGQRTFLQRSLESTIAVQSGDTIVLGGLIRDNTSAGSGGIPYLHRLPGAGWMFGAKDESYDRTELLITITPRVLRDTAEAANVSQEMRTRLERAIRDLTYQVYGSTLLNRPGI